MEELTAPALHPEFMFAGRPQLMNALGSTYLFVDSGLELSSFPHMNRLLEYVPRIKL